MANWDRQYRLKIGKKGGEGFVLGEKVGSTGMPIHVSFSIERNESSTSNQGTIEIWNLSKAHISILEAEDCVVELYAGYGTNMPLIMKGDVVKLEDESDNADMKTKITISDTLKKVKDSYSTVTYKDGTNVKQVIDDCANSMNITVEYGHDAEFSEVPGGFSFVGSTTDILTKMCDSSNLEWSIQNDVLHIKKKAGTLTSHIYVLSAKTGLIGYPSKITEDNEKSKKEKVKGWNVEFLMNAAINVNDYVKLESNKVNGQFRVKSIKVTGDNFGDEWSCQAELATVGG